MCELLSPVGDFECLKAAVQNGADAVYFGANQFNARQNATNFDDEGLKKAIQYAKLRNVKINFTLNTLIKDAEFEDAVNLVKKVYELGADAIIVQDLGLAKYIIDNFPDMDVHASTQMTIHNLEGVQILKDIGFKRVVLSRELSLHEIEYICKNTDVEIECFVHGALCICYSGQCLLSSSIGARSGNRGKCAQPCRLPYKLYEEYKETINEKIDEGYLLSTRDYCSLEYLPDLIKAGVKSFKIEGRMKTPEYVATCTRIYRKYIDLVNSGEQYKVDPNDIKDLMQVFNRGKFSSGNLEEKPNRNYVFKEKPNNMGLYVGNISNFNSKKGHVTFKTNERLEIGDRISFQKEAHNYTISELMKNGENIKEANPGDIITIGRMKGNIFLGDKVYKLSDSSYEKELKEYYSKEHVKIPLIAYVRIKKGTPITLEVTSKDTDNGIYFSMSSKQTSDIIPIDAISNPITEERIKEQLNKTNDTPFKFDDIIFDMDENVYIQKISAINELRRNALQDLENQAIKRFSRNLNTVDTSNEKRSTNITEKEKKINDDANKPENKKTDLSLLLNIVNTKLNYENLEKVENIYVPFKYFKNRKYEDTIKNLSQKANLYIYLPHIVKDNFRNVFFNDFDRIINTFDIYGLAVSNMSCIRYFEKLKEKYKFIGNYTLNVFNEHTINELQSLGINRITLSPELDEKSLEFLSKNSSIDTEILAYGNLRLMTMNYCLLGSSNMCYPECEMKCQKEDTKFYLQDRLNMKFRVIPDNVQTVSAIYNSRTTSISYKDINPSVARISILDENIEEINEIIKKVREDIPFKGEKYTKGNIDKFV